MTEKQKFIEKLTKKAFEEWSTGVEHPLFPESDNDPIHKAWFLVTNVMAYGFTYGAKMNLNISTDIQAET